MFSWWLSIAYFEATSPDDNLTYICYFSQKIGFDIVRKLSSVSLGDSLHELLEPIFGKSKKNIMDLSSAELS